MTKAYVSWVALTASIAAAATGAAINCSGTGEQGRAERTASARHALQTQLSGAIFTTLADGSRVNANQYDAKPDVYLDGGPGPNAPAKAAGLPEGDYFFQVTDPSGKDLLSSDHITCRKVRVSAEGLIVEIKPGTNYKRQGGTWQPIDCKHAEGTDIDHAAKTVQLFPYDDTPNSGGVYKVWMTPVSSYSGSQAAPTQPSDAVNGENWQSGNAHGFLPSASKTDNFKVKKGKPCAPQLLSLKKFHDANLNAVQDTGEPDIEGWLMYVEDPIGAANQYYTTASVNASEGTWFVTENQPAGTWETAAYLDGSLRMTEGTGCSGPVPDTSSTVSVSFGSTCGETHSVLYGNVGLGSIQACKLYDRNANGQADDGEAPIAGWQMTVQNEKLGLRTQSTDATGCTTFTDLLPGEYTVTEIMPPEGGWMSVGASSHSVSITSTLDGSTLSATAGEVEFANLCVGFANFDTKGYWHNKNGLAEITDADIAYVNGLAPYAEPSSYFGAGDEPFNGLFADGTTPVAASTGSWGELLAPAGSSRAEISHFLVDANASGDPREQLAQQLLAFVLNTRHRLDDPELSIQLPNGSISSASGLVAQAIAAWSGSVAADQTAIAMTLDQLNNADAVGFVRGSACPVSYP